MSSLCPVICGTNLDLEEQADRILADGRIGVTKLSEKKDYLSPGQLDRRRQREIYNGRGFPEPHLFAGMFNRAYNPVMADRKRSGGSSDD